MTAQKNRPEGIDALETISGRTLNFDAIAMLMSE